MLPEMDPEICSWILHFLARKRRIGYTLLNALIPFLAPSEDDFLLKKLVLLRSVLFQLDNECAITETTLESLDMIEGFDTLLGLSPPASLVEAFRAVAVECTVRHLYGTLDRNSEYFDALERIWRGKVRSMEEAGPDQRNSLLTDELLRWRTRLEAALHDQSERQELLVINTRTEALLSVRAYLDEAWAGVGPSFLEIVAKICKRKQPCPKDNISPDQGPPSSDNGEKVQRGGPAKTIKVPRNCCTRGVGITDPEELGFGVSVPSIAVTNAKEALKFSYLELQEVVKDPLPDALRVGASLMSLRSDKCNTNPNVGKAVNAADASLKETVETALVVVEKSENQHSSSRQLPKRSLMEWNSTARTYKWDESQDCTDWEANPNGRPFLPSPKRRMVLPLRIYDAKKFSSRRPKKRWSALEQDALVAGIKRFGQGKWKLILDSYPDIFEGRTYVDLKDKWRNIMGQRLL